MSNYIRELQDKVSAAREGLTVVDSTVRDWRAHLQNSPKYQGIDPDGARRDWLAVADVARMLDEIAREVSNVQWKL